MLSEKNLLKEELDRRFQNFLYSDKKDYIAYSLSPVPGRSFSHIPAYYFKQTEPVGKGSIDFIEADNETQFFLWRTTPNNIKQAVKSGIIKFDALTSKCIAALGSYQQTVNKRIYMRGILSNKYEQKNTLLQHVQTNIEALEPLEQIINQYQPHQSISFNQQKLIDALQTYQDVLLTQSKALLNDVELFEVMAPSIRQTWQSQIEDLIQHCQQFEAQIKQTNHHTHLSDLFKPHTPFGLFSFIKQQIDWQIRHVQQVNQNLAFNPHQHALRKGDFNHACEDALREIADYEMDYHNPILPEHQGTFVPQDTFVCLDMRPFCKSKKETSAVLQAICQIEQTDQLVKNSTNDYFIEKDHEKLTSLQTTAYTQWSSNGDPYPPPLKLCFKLWNTLVRIILGLTLDLLCGIVFGLLGRKAPRCSEFLTLDTTNIFSKGSRFDALIAMANTDDISLINQLCLKLHVFLKQIFSDLLYSEKISSPSSSLSIFQNNALIADYAEGHWQQRSTIIQQANNHIADLLQSTLELKQSIHENAPDTYQNLELSLECHTPAIVPFELSSGEWIDITNALSTGMMMGTNIFAHEIYTKNPALGLIFGASYGVALMAVLNPSSVAFLPKPYLHFCKVIGKALAKRETAGAFSGASLQAQSSMAVVESLMNGNASWLSSASKYIEEHPADILIGGALATSFGALLTYRLHIPFISDNLKNELGTFPYPSLAFTGGKGAFLALQLIQTKEISKEALISSSPLMPEHTDNSKNDINKLEFLCFLEVNKKVLPMLTEIQKRALLSQAGDFFEDDISIQQSIHALFYPETTKSVIGVTLKSIWHYIPLSLRCLLMPITQSSTPIIELNQTMHKDLTRLYNAFATTLYGGLNFFTSLGRCLYEITVHETSARIESAITNEHQVANSSYHLLKKLDSGAIHSRSLASSHLNQQKHACTHLSTYSLFNKKLNTAINSPEEIPTLENVHEITL